MTSIRTCAIVIWDTLNGTLFTIERRSTITFQSENDSDKGQQIK